jgi:hypothetical protein
MVQSSFHVGVVVYLSTSHLVGAGPEMTDRRDVRKERPACEKAPGFVSRSLFVSLLRINWSVFRSPILVGIRIDIRLFDIVVFANL